MNTAHRADTLYSFSLISDKIYKINAIKGCSYVTLADLFPENSEGSGRSFAILWCLCNTDSIFSALYFFSMIGRTENRTDLAQIPRRSMLQSSDADSFLCTVKVQAGHWHKGDG